MQGPRRTVRVASVRGEPFSWTRSCACKGCPRRPVYLRTLRRDAAAYHRNVFSPRTRRNSVPMEPTDEASVSNRFDAFLGELDGLTPTTEKQIEKRLRELRNVKRGKPARKPTKKRQQRAAAKKLARPLNPVKKPEAPIAQEPSTTLPPLAPANKEDAAAHKMKIAARDAKQASCPDLDSGATCWGLIPDRTACRVPCTLSVVASPPTLVWHSSNEDNKVQRRTWRWGDLNEDGEPGWVGLDRALEDCWKKGCAARRVK